MGLSYSLGDSMATHKSIHDPVAAFYKLCVGKKKKKDWIFSSGNVTALDKMSYINEQLEI